MFTRSTSTAVKRTGSKLLAVIMILAFLGASLPAGAALAADDCQETYTVKSGDWLVKIAANYDGVIWSDIATANNIKGPSYTLFVGQKLCIPKPGSTGSTGSSGGTTGSTGTGARITFERKSGNKLEISVTNAQARAFYFVKVDDTKQSRLEWFKLGTLRTNADREGEVTFNLPDDMSRATDFNVCLKNTANDDLLCNNASMTRLSGKSSGSSGSTSTIGTFTVTRQSGRITIETSRFPRDSFFNVRVAELKGGSPVYTVLGKLRTDDDTSGTYRYDLTSTLNQARTIRVCLKNTETDAFRCVDSTR